MSVLYVLHAQVAALKPVGYDIQGHPHGFTLTLRRLAPDLVWFADGLADQGSEFPDAGLTAEWNGFGFASRPPEAALGFHNGQPDEDSLIVRLTRPRYDKRQGTLSFAARWVNPDSVTSGPLVADAKAADPTPPRSLSGATLSINDTSPRVINGCVIQPFMECSGADLRGADLHGVNVLGAHLQGANLDHADSRTPASSTPVAPGSVGR